MADHEQNAASSFDINLRMRTVALTLAFLLATTLMANPGAQAQTFKVLHAFSGNADGSYPETGLTMDRGGNLYGTALGGGTASCHSSDYGPGCGTIFKLMRSGSGWTLIPLYSFSGSPDGAAPHSRMVFGPDGRLYGTTINGGQGTCDSLFGVGCGTVFSLRPPASACKTAICPWTETVLYRFSGGSDGGEPLGDLAFDQEGNLYGTTLGGGNGGCPVGCGVVYKLTPSNGGWTESVVYAFTGGDDGTNPWGGVAFDGAGNLYGTTAAGGYVNSGDCYEGCGTVFQLTPSGSGWSENTLHIFQGNDGNFSAAALAFDQQGNLYGDSTSGGTNNGGVVFELSPSNGNWNFSLLQQSLSGGIQAGSWATLTIDSSGNLLGTSRGGGRYGQGYVFRLTESNGVWSFTDVYDFYGGTDGGLPSSSVAFDAVGNLYGTAVVDGAFAQGVIWEITP